MLTPLVELLPLFVVRWLARRHAERLHTKLDGQYVVLLTARPDTFFRKD